MKIIYTAENSIQAAILEGLMKEAGIRAFVSGSDLQGIMGGGASGVVKISVHDNDVLAAREIVTDFETDQAESSQTGT